MTRLVPAVVGLALLGMAPQRTPAPVPANLVTPLVDARASHDHAGSRILIPTSMERVRIPAASTGVTGEPRMASDAAPVISPITTVDGLTVEPLAPLP